MVTKHVATESHDQSRGHRITCRLRNTLRKPQLRNIVLNIKLLIIYVYTEKSKCFILLYIMYISNIVYYVYIENRNALLISSCEK